MSPSTRSTMNFSPLFPMMVDPIAIASIIKMFVFSIYFSGVVKSRFSLHSLHKPLYSKGFRYTLKPAWVYIAYINPCCARVPGIHQHFSKMSDSRILLLASCIPLYTNVDPNVGSEPMPTANDVGYVG